MSATDAAAAAAANDPGAAGAARLHGSAAAAAWVAFAAAAAWFAWRAAPGVTFEDAGELAAAAATLGVPHPPGYPLLMLVGRAWILLCAPLGAEPARALNLLSALCAAGAAALLVRTAQRAGASAGAALCAAVLCVLAPTFAAQAVVTEVYALAALLQAAFLLVALTRPRPALPAFFLLGLATSAHQVSLCLAPVALVATWRSLRSGAEPRRARAVAGRAALAFAAGLLPFAYVPLAAARRPPVDWGGIDSFGDFARHVSRAAYRTDLERDWGAQLAFLAEQLAGQWPLALALGALALAAGRRAVPAHATRGALLAAAGLAAGLLWGVNYPLEPAAKARLAGSYTPLVLATSLVVALGVAGLERVLRERGRARASRPGPLRSPLLWTLLWPVTLLALALPWRAETLRGAGNRRRDDAAARYAAAVLDAAPAHATLVVSSTAYSDVLFFPLLYAQVAQERRPDVVVIERALLSQEWYRAQLARRDPGLAPALERLASTLAARSDLAATPRGRRLASAPFVGALADRANRPLVLVGRRPSANLLGGRTAVAGPHLWHVLARGAARGEAPSDAPAAWTWLPATDADPWTAELRAMARERDLERARALEEAGDAGAAQRLRAWWDADGTPAGS